MAAQENLSCSHDLRHGVALVSVNANARSNANSATWATQWVKIISRFAVHFVKKVLIFLIYWQFASTQIQTKNICRSWIRYIEQFSGRAQTYKLFCNIQESTKDIFFAIFPCETPLRRCFHVTTLYKSAISSSSSFASVEEYTNLSELTVAVCG